jgi:hypothetical protein
VETLPHFFFIIYIWGLPIDEINQVLNNGILGLVGSGLIDVNIFGRHHEGQIHGKISWMKRNINCTRDDRI